MLILLCACWLYFTFEGNVFIFYLRKGMFHSFPKYLQTSVVQTGTTFDTGCWDIPNLQRKASAILRAVCLDNGRFRCHTGRRSAAGWFFLVDEMAYITRNKGESLSELLCSSQISQPAAFPRRDQWRQPRKLVVFHGRYRTRQGKGNTDAHMHMFQT